MRRGDLFGDSMQIGSDEAEGKVPSGDPGGCAACQPFARSWRMDLLGLRPMIKVRD